MKHIDKLSADVYDLVDKCMDPKALEDGDEHFVQFGKAMEKMMRRQLTPYVRKARNISFSALGYGARRLYYLYNGTEGEVFTAQTKMKFMLGNIVEEVMLVLAKLSGHTVTHEQQRIEYRGITGYCDAVIDGVMVDIKSAASFSFQKIKKGLNDENDLFGYRMQLAGYTKGTPDAHQKVCYLWVMDKQLGHIATAGFDMSKMPDVDAKIDLVNEVYKMSEPPERCYEPIPEGKAGNMVLPTGCAYCPFKKTCYEDANEGKGLRTFLYYKGPVHFTEVVKTPNVMELT